MLHCALDLGPEPWFRLAEGKVSGTITWGDGPPLPVRASIRGAHSRKFPKRSLQVDLEGARLPDAPPRGHTVRRLHLNADYIDPTLMRSALSFWLFSQVGAPAPICRHTALTVSGEFAGVYLALESVDKDFCLRRGWAPGQIYYALNRNANFGLISPFTKELKQPLEAGYKMVERADPAPLRRMVMDLNLASDEQFPSVAERLLDVRGYLRWLMVAVFVGNRDGFLHNYALYRNPKSGMFRIIPWDYDATWGIDIHGRPARLDRVPVCGWNKLTHRLMRNASYRALYQRMFRAALSGPLHPDNIHPEIDRMRNRIALWVDTDRHKRQSNDGLDVEVDRIREWAVDRRNLLLSQLESL